MSESERERERWRVCVHLHDSNETAQEEGGDDDLRADHGHSQVKQDTHTPKDNIQQNDSLRPWSPRNTCLGGVSVRGHIS